MQFSANISAEIKQHIKPLFLMHRINRTWQRSPLRTLRHIRILRGSVAAQITTNDLCGNQSPDVWR